MSKTRKKPTLLSSSHHRLSDDVVFDILTRLPVKPIIRFRCVSKSLNSTITDPIFINAHFNLNKAKSLSNNNNNGYLLCKTRPVPTSSEADLCTVVCNNDHTLTEISRFKIPFDPFYIIGFFNGIFCLTALDEDRDSLCTKYFGYNCMTCLWNPSIRKFKMLQANNHFYTIGYGFAYHCQNDDLKVLRFLRLVHKGPLWWSFQAEVYTLSTDSWRLVEPHNRLIKSVWRIESNGLFFNGALHYIAYTRHNNFLKKIILCFDVDDEKFREILLPQNYAVELSPSFDQLAVLKGSLALINFGQCAGVDNELHEIWVMRDYGVAESWTQKVVPLLNFKSIFGCMGSDELMISSVRPFSSDRFFLFDLESLNENNLRIEDLGIENISLEHYTTDLMESLVLLND